MMHEPGGTLVVDVDVVVDVVVVVVVLVADGEQKVTKSAQQSP